MYTDTQGKFQETLAPHILTEVKVFHYYILASQTLSQDIRTNVICAWTCLCPEKQLPMASTALALYFHGKTKHRLVIANSNCLRLHLIACINTKINQCFNVKQDT